VSDTDNVLQHQLDRQRASMLEAVREYEQRLEAQSGRIAELEMELAGAAAQEGELRAEIERLRIVVEERGADLGRLDAENDALRTTIDELTGSRSWRITRPLRALGRGTRQLGASDTDEA
jgi:chromosome segregation ATPase